MRLPRDEGGFLALVWDGIARRHYIRTAASLMPLGPTLSAGLEHRLSTDYSTLEILRDCQIWYD